MKVSIEELLEMYYEYERMENEYGEEKAEEEFEKYYHIPFLNVEIAFQEAFENGLIVKSDTMGYVPALSMKKVI